MVPFPRLVKHSVVVVVVVVVASFIDSCKYQMLVLVFHRWCCNMAIIP